MGRTSNKRELILNFLTQFVQEHGYAPTVREICSAVGLQSTATVHYHLNALRDAGLINMDEMKKRTISLPDAYRADRIPIVGVVTARQALLGVPVFGAELTFTYQNGTLCAVSGTVCPGNGTAQRVSEQECMSCADALTQILASRDETGWVGSRILSVQQGYLHAETAAAALRFVPMWQIETDTALFFVNGITGEVRQSAA